MLPPVVPSPPEPESPPRLYLPELDGLRFLAFLLVFLFHLGGRNENVAALVGRTSARAFRENGWVGVQLFFILSGYLIVTLLLREEAAFGRVDLRAFWIRRILRIWPLFYLTVAIAFLVIPAVQGGFADGGAFQNLRRHFSWFLLFLGNWSMAIQGPVTLDSQSILWSVCVEEQFYIIVPLLIALVPGVARIPTVLALMVVALGCRAWLAYGAANQLMLQYNTLAQFDTLLSGVLLALVLGTEPRSHLRTARVLRGLQWPIYALALWVFTRSNLGHGEPWRRVWDFVAIWGVGVGIVAVAVIVPGWLRAGLSFPGLVRLGRISYGLYMYHEIGFWLRDGFGRLVGWFPFQDILLPVLALGITVGLASVSYDHFESRFLRLKRRWTRVPSRPD